MGQRVKTNKSFLRKERCGKYILTLEQLVLMSELLIICDRGNSALEVTVIWITTPYFEIQQSFKEKEPWRWIQCLHF